MVSEDTYGFAGFGIKVISQDIGFIANLAEWTGSSQPALRLLISILAGYPIAAVHRQLAPKLTPLMHHVFFATCGFSMCIFNFGIDIYHSVIAILTTYILVRQLHHKPRQLLTLNFIFHMSYLLIGYRFMESNNYDICWTTLHCVLVLRLIGFGFDITDGQKPSAELSKDQQETALSDIPSLIELTAYSYFPPACLVGPQFPLRRYQLFIQGEFREYTGSIRAGLIRGGIGLCYLMAWRLGTTIWPDSYILTDAFRIQSTLAKLIETALWVKVSLYKYISCWLLVEGALMCTGLTYAGRTEDGKEDWSGCTNVKLIILETGTKMNHYVQSFNVNTNAWMSQYIYKRLKFFDNRTLSYGATLTFLAAWHGFHSGYYVSFFMEFCIVTVEKQLESLYNKEVLPRYGHILNSSKIYQVSSFVVLKFYNVIYMGWGGAPFMLRSYDRWMSFFASLNYVGFIFLGVQVAFYSICNLAFKFINTREHQE